MEKIFMSLCMDMWAGDVSISYDAFIKEVKRIIENLKSYIGIEAHKKLEEIGVVDNTGMSWEEQDEYHQKQIKEYQDLLTYLENDSNWTW